LGPSRVVAEEEWLRLGCPGTRLRVPARINGHSFRVPARSAVSPLSTRELTRAITEQTELPAKSFYSQVLVAGSTWERELWRLLPPTKPAMLITACHRKAHKPALAPTPSLHPRGKRTKTTCMSVSASDICPRA